MSIILFYNKWSNNAHLEVVMYPVVTLTAQCLSLTAVSELLFLFVCLFSVVLILTLEVKFGLM